MGEGIPYWFYRIDNRYEMETAMGMEHRDLKRRPSEYFRDHFAITTSGVNSNPPLELCISVLGADKIMFAIDYPYQDTIEAVEWMNAAPLSDEDKQLVFSANAERIFGI